MGQAPGAVCVSRPGALARARAYLSLLKMRIVLPLTAVAAISAIVANNGAVPFDTILFLLLAGGLASAGSACLNHYFDRDIDALMERTRNRPLPTGQIRNPASVLVLGMLLIGVATVFGSRLNHLSLAFVALGAFFYVVVYT